MRGRSCSPPHNPHRWRGRRILITAGPTREYFDPVRFLSNPSSGKMGYAIAEAALRQGAKVTLISGPVPLPRPEGTRYFLVTTAEEMYRTVMREAQSSHLIIMAAAVSDWRPAIYSSRKVKKKGGSLTVKLVPTRDILKELGRKKKPGQILVGFAAETDHLIRNAQKKLREKNLDIIVANWIGRRGSGFESSTNRALLFLGNGKQQRLPLMSKKKMAERILKTMSACR